MEELRREENQKRVVLSKKEKREFREGKIGNLYATVCESMFNKWLWWGKG